MSSLGRPADFIDNSNSVIEGVLTSNEKSITSLEELVKTYEIEKTINTILNQGYERIALQFPDSLLAYSTQIFTILRKRTLKKIFILADTSYGSCCVDEVAAQHVDADFIVHYGGACLSPTSRLPVLYIFGNQSVDMDHLYAHCIYNFLEELSNMGYSNLIRTYIKTQENIQATSCEREIQPSPGTKGRYYKLPVNLKINDCSIFYIGGESLSLTNLIMTHNKCQVLSYDPKTRQGRRETLKVNRALMRRYNMVQKAKDADVIGIVVGTLGVGEVQLITQAGKKAYTFIMGKLNVAKMANFMEIDCYVLVACPENSLIDSKEFYRPIVTPFELEIALDKSKSWTGEYITDFQDLLFGIADNPDEMSRDFRKVDDNDEDQPYFSLITGKLKQGRKYVSRENDACEDGNTTDLVLRNQNMSISTYLNSAAGEFLNSRSFRGLQEDVGLSEVPLVEEGQSGIAKGYSNEISN
ncbi:hypothetical protein G9A89_022515 [Geosiphon pyriformis]|nr:hypothetical protein G9A89_022515 [Geosiphon pyriformis]